MPLQNRVTPFGEILALDALGTLMGNRGIIHNPTTRQLLTRRWQHRAWICCVLEYKGYQHPIMGKGRYTELFFLDEATAFAAGHRPCAYCRRADFNTFKRAWAKAQNISPDAVRAPKIDHQLHSERVTRTRQQITYAAQIDDLPDGTLIHIDGQPWLVQDNRLLQWSAQGYQAIRRRRKSATVEVLTPRSTVAAMGHGYAVSVHASALTLIDSADRLNR